MDASFRPLTSDRIRLRRFRAEDASTLHAYRSDPEVARYQGWGAFSSEDAQQFAARQAAAQPGALGSGAQIALELRDTGEMIGDVYLHTPRETPEEARIGYTLARAHQGRGLATEAVCLLLDWVFGPLEKHRVTALTYACNQPSVALLERIGMRREAHHRESSLFEGRWADDYIYALLQEEWPTAAVRERLLRRED